uniref:F-box domain-containing protein n=1 Tax=Oryza glumipatula TaxID=40148 RepID=A0A0D9Z4K5_9ORYZ
MDQADRRRCRRRHQELEHAAADDYGGAFSCHLPLHSGFKIPRLPTTACALMRRKKTHRTKLSLENLPGDLLCKVVSQLTVKEAGQTSILSSRWRDRWIYHSNLCFDHSEFPRYTADRFINYVNHVLQQHSFLAVDRFEIRFPLQKQQTKHVDSWVAFASASRAKHFVLDLSPAVHTNHQTEEHKYEFPVDLLNGQNGSPIISLRLSLVCLKLPSDFLGFKDLKELELHLISDLGNLINLFLTKCPALERLSLSHCSMTDLNIPDALCHLQYLKVVNCCVQSIESHAMSLTTFEYAGVPVPIKLDDSLKLSQANITLNKGSGNMNYIVNQLTCSLAHVGYLLIKLSTFDTKVSSTTVILDSLPLFPSF